MAKAKSTAEQLPDGVVDLAPPPEQLDDSGEGAPAGTKFWRCRIHLVTHIEPGAPDHVVRADDRANAEAAFFQEMGILSVDRTVNRFTVDPATELDFIVAQAKRLRLDLREQRKVDVPKKHADYGRLTWQPPGGRKGEYKVSDKGELTAVE